jgi:hypothetical protein
MGHFLAEQGVASVTAAIHSHILASTLAVVEDNCYTSEAQALAGDLHLSQSIPRCVDRRLSMAGM